MEAGKGLPTTPIIDTYTPEYLAKLKKDLENTTETTKKEELHTLVDTVAKDVFTHLEKLNILAKPVSINFVETYNKFLDLSKTIDPKSDKEEVCRKCKVILDTIATFPARPKVTVSESPDISQPLTAPSITAGAPRIRRPAFLRDTPEDVPRSQDLYDINIIAKRLAVFKQKELLDMTYVATIDEGMREVTLTWSAFTSVVEVIEDFLKIPEKNRDFTKAQASLSEKLKNMKEEELKCYKSLLGARDAIMSKSKIVLLTKELKNELYDEFSESIDKKFSETFKTFNLDSLKRLKELKDKIEELLFLKDEMLEKKVAIHMESEDRKVTAEYRALRQARREFNGNFDSTNIFEAAENGDLDFIEGVYSKATLPDARKFLFFTKLLEQKNELGYSVLDIACYYGYEDIVDWLLLQQTSRKIPCSFGYLPLHWAAKGGHLNICKKLCAKKPMLTLSEINHAAFGKYDRTALHIAAYNNFPEIVRFLLELGANPNARTSKENGCVTPLHEAIQQGHNVVAALFLDRNSNTDVETFDGEGRTALWWAISLGNTAIASLLIGHGTYKRNKDPRLLNSIANLLLVQPAQNRDSVRKFLESLL